MNKLDRRYCILHERQTGENLLETYKMNQNTAFVSWLNLNIFSPVSSFSTRFFGTETLIYGRNFEYTLSDIEMN